MAIPIFPTDQVSDRLRARGIDLPNRRILVSNLHGTTQELDLSEPANCDGFGRIRHFRRATSPGWPENPLPIDPACAALNLPLSDVVRAQAFQNSICNWRCWYCYVPYGLLSGNQRHAEWLSPAELLLRYQSQVDPPQIIDLTGGQPDLTPEWIPWTMTALEELGIQDKIYLWSDDNLSNDFFWRYLTQMEIEQIVKFRNYGRVGCFKGFDDESFAFNTTASPGLFDRQFSLMKKMLMLGIDVYAYATFTTPEPGNIRDGMKNFIDRLQTLHENLPLRTVPLEIRTFTPVHSRMNDARTSALKHQWLAIDAWNREIQERFTSESRELRIHEVSMHA